MPMKGEGGGGKVPFNDGTSMALFFKKYGKNISLFRSAHFSTIYGPFGLVRNIQIKQ
jgi:hypothetical protein